MWTTLNENVMFNTMFIKVHIELQTNHTPPRDGITGYTDSREEIEEHSKIETNWQTEILQGVRTMIIITIEYILIIQCWD